MSFQIVTIGAMTDEIDRTTALAKIVKASKSLQIGSLEEISPLLGNDFKACGLSVDQPILVRLFGSSQVDALRWLGPKGRVVTEAAVLGIVDGLLISAKEPPRAVMVLPTAIVAAFASFKMNLDTSGSAMVIGVSDEIRSVAAGLARLGYKKIVLVDADDSRSTAAAQVLQRRLFNIEIVPLSSSLLTQAASDSSFAVNLAGNKAEALIEDASYLNFLKKKGVWIDWSGSAAGLGHAEEIKSSTAQIVAPESVWAWRDALLIAAFEEISVHSGQKPEVLAADLMKAWSIHLKLVQPSTSS